MHKSRGVNRNVCHERASIDGAGPAIEIAVDLYRNKKVSLWKAAEIAGLCMEEFKDLLCALSIKIEIGGTNEESLSRLERLGLLELDEKDGEVRSIDCSRINKDDLAFDQIFDEGGLD